MKKGKRLPGETALRLWEQLLDADLEELKIMLPFSLEHLFQSWRINKILPHFKYGGKLLDIGCDDPPRLIDLVKNKMKGCVGIDIAIENRKYENVELFKMDLGRKIGLTSNHYDVISMLAVLEHMKHPKEIISECYRLMKPGGVILITVPSPRNKPLVELLAKIGLLRQEMIDQHENYFTQSDLKQMLKQAGFKKVEVSLFEVGLNTFAMANK